LPRELRRGRYILALAILDPAGMTAACRFAIENYFAGGRHPLGRIGIGQDVGVAELDAHWFEDLTSDTSIGYRSA
jgi:hypothetical protein